ncbi:MAG: SDR family oxidoreductase [Acetobacteraceae bacterium]|nr:SDR family oxidoreductase [Acetobacteraceae bacterium]
MSAACAVVTGGASGIGARIRDDLLAAGYQVVVLDRQAPDATHPRLHQRALDLADPDATSLAAAEIAAAFAVTHLIHNAGVIRPAPLADVQPAAFVELTNLHLVAPTLLLQAFLPRMRAERFGRVVLMSSRAALGAQTRTAYGATKAGVIGLVRTWALELARDGITVNAVAPGPVAGTAMFHDIVPAGSEREQALVASIPVGRLGTPDDVSRAVLFFAAAENSFVTGQTLFVCGGASVSAITI